MTGDLLDAMRCCCREPRLSELTARQLAMLLAIDRLDWLMHMLAEHLDVSLSVISRGADALIAKGLIERRHEPGDKRRVWLRVTASGRDALEAVYAGGADPTLRDLHRMVKR